MPLAQREPLLLCYWQGLTQDQAARRLGCTAGAIKGRLERGRARLAERLARRGFGPEALLLGPMTAAAVSRDLLARTAAIAATPWSPTIPATVVTLAAMHSKLIPACVISTLLAGAGMIALAAGAGPQAGTPKPSPPPAVAAGPAMDRYGDPLPPGAIARLGTLRFRNDGRGGYLSVRTGGRVVAFSTGYSITFMEVHTGQIVRRIERIVNGRRSSIFGALAFAPDGLTFAVGGWDENAPFLPFWLYDTATGERLRKFAGHEKPVKSLAFLMGGRQLASLGDDGVVRIWDVATGFKLRELTDPDRKLASMAASPDGKVIATGAEEKNGAAAIYLWDVTTGKMRRTLVGHTAEVKVVAFAPDGRTLASGDNAVRLWDVASGRQVRQYGGLAEVAQNGFRQFLLSLAFSPDGRTLATFGTDSVARSWSVATGEILDTVPIPSNEENALAFLDDRKLLIGGAPRLWVRDIHDRAFADGAVGHAWPVVSLAFTADGRTVATTDGASQLRTWDAETGRPLAERTHTDTTIISPNGRLLAVTEFGTTGDLSVRLDDAASGRTLRRLPGMGHFPVAFSYDSRRLATLVHREKANDGTLRIWDVAHGTKMCEFTAGNMENRALAFSPDGRFIFTGANGMPVQQRDTATGRVLKEYPVDERLAVSAGGRRLVTGYHGAVLRLWDVVTGEECWRAEVKGGPGVCPEAIAFSPDGTFLAEGYREDGESHIDILDALTGNHLARLEGHGPNRAVWSLAFSADGRRLASGSSDCTVLVWDMEKATGRRIVGPLDPVRQTQLWAELAGGGMTGAHAIDCLQAAPTAAIPILKPRLRSSVAVPADRIAPFLIALDSPSFAAREKAQRDLAALGSGAEPAVRSARDTANAEVRRRIDAVLAGWESEQKRAGRAVEILEYIATQEARKLLADLAGGDPAAQLTRQAREALARLARIEVPGPGRPQQ